MTTTTATRSERRALVWSLALGLLVSVLAPASAHAHHPRSSRLVLSLRPGGAASSLHLPADQLGLALAVEWDDESLRELAQHPERLDTTFRERLRGYVRTYLSMSDERGTRYELSVGEPRWTVEDDTPFVVLDVDFRAPDGHPASALEVHDEVVSEEVVNHRTIVVVARDFEQARFEESEKIVGTLSFTRRSITLDREGASPWRGALGMLELGARHIAEGIDHLLFVLVLLLAAPLLAGSSGDRASAGRFARWRALRWREVRSTRNTVRHVVGLVTAFTLGHSLTLALGAYGVGSGWSQPVEVAIGVSIAFGALHAIHPLVPRREALVAASFGLIHGLAFASTLEGMGLRGSALLWALGPFNIGIELVQLVIVVAIAPLLALAARAEGYTLLRAVFAAFAGIAAGAWVLERLGGGPNFVTSALERAAESPASVWVGLWLALAVWNVLAHGFGRLRGTRLDAAEAA